MCFKGQHNQRKRKQSSSIVEDYAKAFGSDNKTMLCLSVTVPHVLPVLLTCDL